MTTSSGLDFELMAFFPADHAEAPNGKLYVHGAFFNRLTFPAYPQVLPAMSLVAVLKVPFSQYLSEHRFKIGMVDQDGKALALTIEGAFRVGAGADLQYGDPTVMPIAVPVYGLVIERPGDYCFTFSVDEEPLGTYSVRALQIAVPLQFSISPPPAPEAEAS